MIRLVRVLLAGLLALLVPALAQPVAYAAADQGVAIAIDQFDPAVPDRTATITIRGRVTNTTTDPITLAQALLWRDWSPITSRDSLDVALASGATQPYGGRVTDQGAFQSLTTDQKPSLAPGDTVPFEVRAPVSALELPRTGGVYLMGVHVVGKAGRRGNATLGRARVLVPMPRQATTPVATDPVDVPTVVMLTSRPRLVRPGVLSDDGLAEELSTNGRLAVLMKAAARPDVSYAIDPALLQSVREMADGDGYQVRQADGSLRPGAGQAMARRWLLEYSALNESRGFRTPFGVPDLTTIAHQALDETFRRAVVASDQVPEVHRLPLLAYTHGGLLDAEAVQWAERLVPSAILTANAQTAHALLEPLTAAPLVSYNPDVYAGGPGPDPRTTAVHRRQRLLAETWIAASTRTGPQVHVIADEQDALADLAAAAGWMKRVPLNDLLVKTPAEWSRQLDYTPQMRDAELSPAQVNDLRELTAAQAAYADILTDPAPRRRETDALIARTASSWWRGDLDAYTAWIGPLLAESARLLNGSEVSLNAQRTVIMSGQEGSFPVTVTNGLSHPVRVAIDFTSDQPQRLSIARHDNIEVEAGQSTTVNVRPRAAANGPVMVGAQLITPGGTPLGRRTRLEVRATNFGFVGWIIVVASGVVLLGATAFRIRQVARERVLSSAARSAGAESTGTQPVVPVEPIERSGE